MRSQTHLSRLNSATPVAAALLLAGLVLPVGQASAASCTVIATPQTIAFGLVGTTPSPDSVTTLQCGTGNINGADNDGFLDVFGGVGGYQFLTDQSALDLTGTKSGNWSIDLTKLTGFSDFAIGLKAGNGYGVFALGDDTAGTWSISKDISHANLYGKTSSPGPTPVPLPAAAWLFGSALLGIGGIGYRRGTRKV